MPVKAFKPPVAWAAVCSKVLDLFLLIHLGEEERAGCFTLIVLLMSCDCCVALPHSTVGWSAV